MEGRNTTEVANGARIINLPVAAGAVIYDGVMVAVENGFAIPAEKKEGLTVIGRAEQYADNTKGSDGDLTVNVKRGVFIWENATGEEKITAADIMENCYISDCFTVTKLQTGSSVAGKIVGVYADGIAVETL